MLCSDPEHGKPGLRLARADLAVAIVIRAQLRFFVLSLNNQWCSIAGALALNIYDLPRAWESIDEECDVTAY